MFAGVITLVQLDDGAQLVYAGRAGGLHAIHKGGGGNPQCLPLA